MSLINKMLQDLDARGGAGEQLHQPEVKAVPGAERDNRTAMLAAGGAVAVLVLAAGGWLGWKYWQGRVVAHAVTPAPMAAAPATPATPPAPSAPPAPAVAPAQQVAAAVPPRSQPPQTQPVSLAPALPSAAAAGAGGAAEQAHVHGKRDKQDKQDKRAARAERAAHEAAHGSKAAAHSAAAKDKAKPAAPEGGEIVHELSPSQLSENTYRRALVALQEGRVSEALADLERSLEINPRNDAARQTFISLLLENKRTDDAIRQLRLALGIDPRQPGLAMVLARLQLERNGPALETLQRTLPYAENSADYQALLAGVLQRQQRHAEAIEHYDIALKLAPQNAVWWMGLGISLQAERHNPEARAAFTRARALPGLSAELQAFIDRKLELLSR